MEQIPEEKAVRDNVFAAIASGKVKMRSRWYFGLQTSAILVGSVIVAPLYCLYRRIYYFQSLAIGSVARPRDRPYGLVYLFPFAPLVLILLSLIFVLVLVPLFTVLPSSISGRFCILSSEY